MYFKEEYAFLSNFAFCEVRLDGVPYRSVEHAYQAAKTLDVRERTQVHDCPTPAHAKKLGRTVTQRPDFNEVRIEVMRALLAQKFACGTRYRELLDDVEGDIIEDNWWGDRFWGVYRGEGQNHLGRLLMELRS